MGNLACKDKSFRSARRHFTLDDILRIIEKYKALGGNKADLCAKVADNCDADIQYIVALINQYLSKGGNKQELCKALAQFCPSACCDLLGNIKEINLLLGPLVDDKDSILDGVKVFRSAVDELLNLLNPFSF